MLQMQEEMNAECKSPTSDIPDGERIDMLIAISVVSKKLANMLRIIMEYSLNNGFTTSVKGYLTLQQNSLP